MSYDRKAPEPLIGGAELGLTRVSGSITTGGAYVMRDEERDRLYFTALAADRVGRFTRPMGKEEDRASRAPMLGEHYGWNPRQQAAARRLASLWKKSLRGLGAPGGYGDRTRGGGEISDQEAEAATQAFREYSNAMDWLGERCGHRHVEAVRQAVIYESPAPLARSYLAREGLTELASMWRLA
jgi:hypothetical protein